MLQIFLTFSDHYVKGKVLSLVVGGALELLAELPHRNRVVPIPNNGVSSKFYDERYILLVFSTYPFNSFFGDKELLARQVGGALKAIHRLSAFQSLCLPKAVDINKTLSEF